VAGVAGVGAGRSSAVGGARMRGLDAVSRAVCNVDSGGGAPLPALIGVSGMEAGAGAGRSGVAFGVAVVVAAAFWAVCVGTAGVDCARVGAVVVVWGAAADPALGGFAGGAGGAASDGGRKGEWGASLAVDPSALAAAGGGDCGGDVGDMGAVWALVGAGGGDPARTASAPRSA